MSDYKHRLTDTEELKKLNLQNLQFSIRISELEKENRALKDHLARIITGRSVKQEYIKPVLACHYRQAQAAE